MVGIPIFAKQWTFDTENVTHLLSAWNAIVEDYQVQKYAQNTQVPTNLFVLNMEKYDTQRWSIMLEGIQGTKLFLQQQYPRCLLSDTQISALLFFTHKEFARELRQQLPEKAHPTALAYQEACKTLTTCVEGEKSKNLNKVCETLVRQAYSMHASLQQNKLLIEESNLRQDIYQNGNTDDASYDLMDDIAVIGKLWFEDTQEPPELIFYRSPQFSTRADNPQRSQRTVSTGGRASLPVSQTRSS